MSAFEVFVIVNISVQAIFNGSNQQVFPGHEGVDHAESDSETRLIRQRASALVVGSRDDEIAAFQILDRAGNAEVLAWNVEGDANVNDDFY